MNHHKAKRKFGRTRSQRTALLRGLAISLIEHGRITTTDAKARELRPFIEEIVTHGKKGTLASRRLIISRLGGNEDNAKKMVEEISPRFVERPGGYTRILKLPRRAGDASKMAIIEFVG
jgi:large subunit ribosomal protein L17